MTTTGVAQYCVICLCKYCQRPRKIDQLSVKCLIFRPWTNKLDSEYTLVGCIFIPPRNEFKQIKNLLRDKLIINYCHLKQVFISLVDHNSTLPDLHKLNYRWTTSPKMSEWISFLEKQTGRIALNNPLCIEHRVSMNNSFYALIKLMW